MFQVKEMQYIILIVLGLGLVTALEVKEVKNPILPVHIGQTKIITSKHTFIYHVNLTTLENSLLNIKLSLNKLQQTMNQQRSLNHYSILIANKILNAVSLENIITNKIRTFTDNHRVKRGLLNIIGKTQKWLFGTLDSDDEQYIKSYLDSLQSNENKLNDNLKQQHSLLKLMSETYNDQFQKLPN